MNIHGNVDPIHALLTQQLHSSDPTRAARMHTIIKALTTSLLATKNLTQGRVYVHRGVNANKEAFFRAVQESVLPGVSWWLEDINSAWTLNNHLRNIMSQMVEGQRRHGWSRYPVLIVLNRVPPAWMPVISDMLGALIEASPMMQIHVLQDVPLPCNIEIVEGLSVENFVWRTQEMLAMRPEELPSRIFTWLCLRSEQTAPSEAPATAPAAPAAAPAPQAGQAETDSLTSLLGAQLLTDSPERVMRLHSVISTLTCSLSAMPSSREKTHNIFAHQGDNPTKLEFFRALYTRLRSSAPAHWLDFPSDYHGDELGELIGNLALASQAHETYGYPTLVILNGWPTDALRDNVGELCWVADASPAVQVHILQSAPFPSPPVTIPSIPIETFQWRSTTAPPVATTQELIPRLDRWLSLAARPQPSAATSAATLQPGQKTVPSAPETSVEQKTVGEQVAEEMVRLHEASSEGRQAASDYADFAVSNAGLVARSLLSLSAETLALKRTAADSSRTLNAPAGQVLRQMAERAAKTAIYPGAGTGDFAARVYTALALAGEAGEVAGKASKTLRDGATPDLVARLHMELGDTFWHWLMACQEWGADPDAVVAQMFSRLQDRQERGVLAGSGDAR